MCCSDSRRYAVLCLMEGGLDMESGSRIVDTA